MIKYFDLDVSLEEFYKERIDSFLTVAEKELKMMPGLLHSLELCKKEGYVIALASSGAMQYINLVLDKFDIRSYFGVIVSGDCVTKGKPDPEAYRVACEKLGLPPGECLVLEDATNGIVSAKAAGCYCIAVENPHTPVQDLSQADHVIATLEELNEEMITDLA